MLTSGVRSWQCFPSGLAALFGTGNTPYLEHQGVVAAAIGEALVQDYDGTLRVAPAWPAGWDVDGTVSIQHKGKVFVQIRNGNLTTVALSAGANGTVTVRNPWPGQNVQVVDGAGTVVLTNQTSGTISLPAQAGSSYVVQRASAPTSALPYYPVSGSPATSAKSYNSRTIGLPR